MVFPLLPIAAGVGIAGGLTGMAGTIGSMFGMGQPEQGYGRADWQLGEPGAGWYGFEDLIGRSYQDAWKRGILPLPLQRSLQAIYPMTQMMYSGAMDEATQQTLADREGVAREMARFGITGPQAAARQQALDDRLRATDLLARRQATGQYAQAQADMWKNIYSGGINDVFRMMNLAAGAPAGQQTPWQGLSALGQGLGQIGTNLMDLVGSPLPRVPDYAGQIGAQFPEWSATIPQPTPPSFGSPGAPANPPPRIGGGGPNYFPNPFG